MGSYVSKAWNSAATLTNATGFTDGNGNVSLQIPSQTGVIYFSHQGDTAYYSTGGQYQYSWTNTNGGKWQPWNPTVDVVVKPILNPIPMYARNMGASPDDVLKLPQLNTPIGFDLEAADWVAPYGKGASADFIFTLSDKGSTNGIQKPTESTLTISFPNKGDGIQSVISSAQNQESALRLPRYAPEGGFESPLVIKKSSQYTQGLLNQNQNNFFRVRTLLDEQGHVKSALYGKIAGPILIRTQGRLQFTYYLNPTPNDRNMEFNPTKNLFQNLPMMQQVKAP